MKVYGHFHSQNLHCDFYQSTLEESIYRKWNYFEIIILQKIGLLWESAFIENWSTFEKIIYRKLVYFRRVPLQKIGYFGRVQLQKFNSRKFHSCNFHQNIITRTEKNYLEVFADVLACSLSTIKNIIKENIKNIDFLKMTTVPSFSVKGIRAFTLQIEISEILHLKFPLCKCQ